MEQVVLLLQVAPRQFYKQVVFWVPMELVDGYQLLELQLLLVLFTPIAHLLQEHQHHNVKHGEQLVSQMEQPVFQNLLVLVTQQQQLVPTQVQMELVSG